MTKDEAEKKGEEAPKEESKGKKGKKGKKAEEDISEEDKALIEQMQLLVTRSADSEKGIRMNALTAMAKEIREATSSMTSVPKPLKFLRPHYATLKEHYVRETEDEVRPPSWPLCAGAPVQSRALGHWLAAAAMPYAPRARQTLPFLPRRHKRAEMEQLVAVFGVQSGCGPHPSRALICSQVKLMLADVLSVLAMTMSDDGRRESLEYKLVGSGGKVGAWGHEYVRHLAAEVGEEYNARLAAADALADKARASAKAEGAVAPSDVGDDAMETETTTKPAELLLPLVVDEMVPFFVHSNAEAEAIDLLMEVGKLEALTPHVDATNCDRICMYLVQVSQYVPEPEDTQVGRAAVLRRAGGRRAGGRRAGRRRI
jgi:26S proteasome regulatory subunit N1